MSKIFSLEDFEKGLMLAGLVTPSTIREHEELARLEAHEKLLREKEKQTYFKRVFLAPAGSLKYLSRITEIKTRIEELNKKSARNCAFLFKTQFWRSAKKISTPYQLNRRCISFLT
jgi:hypothetical protein